MIPSQGLGHAVKREALLRLCPRLNEACPCGAPPELAAQRAHRACRHALHSEGEWVYLTPGERAALQQVFGLPSVRSMACGNTVKWF